MCLLITYDTEATRGKTSTWVQLNKILNIFENCLIILTSNKH